MNLITYKLIEIVIHILDKYATNKFNKSINKSNNAKIKYPVYLINPQYVNVGINFSAGPGLRLECYDRYTGITYKPKVVLGNNVKINHNVHIGAIGNISIGNDVLIGSNVLITDHMHGDLTDKSDSIPIKDRPLISRGPVIIGDNVWIGENVCIMDNVIIGSNAIIAANSTVTKNVREGDIVGGVPAVRFRNIYNKYDVQ